LAGVHVTDDVPPGVVWIRDGWVGGNHLTSGDAVLTRDALTLFPFSVSQSDYVAQVDVARIPAKGELATGSHRVDPTTGDGVVSTAIELVEAGHALFKN